MTDKTQPEALRLALSIDLMDTFTNYQQEELDKVREALDALDALEAQLEAVGAGGVQALSAAPAGWKLVPLEPTEAMFTRFSQQIEEGVVYVGGFLQAYRALLAASPTPPAEQQAITPETGNSVSAQGTAITSESGKPPAEQQAAPKAAQEEMDKEASNARLDIDSNSTEPEQQRDVACSLEVGQHVGNGEHQEASCRGPKDSELLKIAARNLKYFIAHAQFSSFADKRAALNCLDALAAPQQEAQDSVSPRHPVVMQWRDNAIEACAKIADAYGHEHAAQDMRAMLTAPQQEAQKPVAWYEYNADLDAWFLAYRRNPKAKTRPLVFGDTAHQPAPAPLSDDAKDAARWRMVALIGNEVMLHPEKRTQAAAVKAYMDATHSGLDLTVAVDAAIAAQGGA